MSCFLLFSVLCSLFTADCSLLTCHVCDLSVDDIVFLEILAGFSFNSLFYLRYFHALSMSSNLRIAFLFGCGGRNLFG
jgi:hypothetical protein